MHNTFHYFLSQAPTYLCSISVYEDLVFVSAVSLPPPDSAGYLSHWLDHPRLIVGQHDGDKNSVWTESSNHLLVINCSSSKASLHNAKFYRKK